MKSVFISNKSLRARYVKYINKFDSKTNHNFETLCIYKYLVNKCK